MAAVLTKNGKRILASAAVREEVARLSTGTYYTQFAHWVGALGAVLDKHHLQLSIGIETPHNQEGRGMRELITPSEEVVGHMWFSYYRMESGNWEVICYLG